MPHPDTGESVVAYVVRQDPTLTVQEVREHCRRQLAAYKVPSRVEFRDELPKSPIGKILRKELRRDPPANARSA
jgi:long-chain acyl-CoA synthetase